MCLYIYRERRHSAFAKATGAGATMLVPMKDKFEGNQAGTFLMSLNY